jgi:tRNA pseudouridine55 synthase
MARGRKGDPVHGWILLDKPLELSSAQAVARVKRIFNAAKAGHAGTLDPLATGMLPIALGEATKTVPFIMDGKKTYGFTLRFGHETRTDDLEGTPTLYAEKIPQPNEIIDILPKFLGQIEQTPPIYSAIKKNGERAYELARNGEDIELAARQVEIYALKFLGLKGADAQFEVTCGKGTYVRALGRDMARALGSAGHIASLRREDVGPFRRESMISLVKLNDLAHKSPGPEGLFSVLRPLQTALDDIPALALSEAQAERLIHGQSISNGGAYAGTLLTMFADKPVALVEANGNVLEPRRVFNL